MQIVCLRVKKFGLEVIRLRETQRNWIGKSTGALIKFQIQNSTESITVLPPDQIPFTESLLWS